MFCALLKESLARTVQKTTAKTLSISYSTESAAHKHSSGECLLDRICQIFSVRLYSETVLSYEIAQKFTSEKNSRP